MRRDIGYHFCWCADEIEETTNTHIPQSQGLQVKVTSNQDPLSRVVVLMPSCQACNCVWSRTWLALHAEDDDHHGSPATGVLLRRHSSLPASCAASGTLLKGACVGTTALFTRLAFRLHVRFGSRYCHCRCCRQYKPGCLLGLGQCNCGFLKEWYECIYRGCCSTKTMAQQFCG